MDKVFNGKRYKYYGFVTSKKAVENVRKKSPKYHIRSVKGKDPHGTKTVYFVYRRKK